MAAAQRDEARKRAETIERIERVTEVPLMLLALAMTPLILGHFLFDLSETERAVFIVLDIAIWSVFAAVFVTKLVIAADRWAYVRSHWLEAAIVLMPLFRPLLVLRLVVFGSRAALGVQRVFHLNNLIAGGVGLVLLSATVVLVAEQGENPAIQDFPDALWWALVTISTVGYGDTVPATAAGRVTAVVVMLGGIAFFGALAGNLASLLFSRSDGSRPARAEHTEEARTLDALVEEVRALRREVAELRQDVAAR